MASLRTRPDTGELFVDFTVDGVRHRERLGLVDTPGNRVTAQRRLACLEQDLADGCFVWARHFPHRRRRRAPSAGHPPTGPIGNPPPLLAHWARQWLLEREPLWRPATRRALHLRIERHLIPTFGSTRVDQIEPQAIWEFRARLAHCRVGREVLRAPASVNRILDTLLRILSDAAARFGFALLRREFGRLKVSRPDARPFTLAEVRRLVDAAPAGFGDYLQVRFFTGLRTGEIDGLKWEHVDFKNGGIRVRETWSLRQTQVPKSDAARRSIEMSAPVREALERQKARTWERSPYVFCSRTGGPLATNNVTDRLWRPLLTRLGLAYRRMYQTRHTAASLWLDAHENPTWIARQLGHASPELLFETYARFTPNLTRRDGTGFERLIARAWADPAPGASAMPPTPPTRLPTRRSRPLAADAKSPQQALF